MHKYLILFCICSCGVIDAQSNIAGGTIQYKQTTYVEAGDMPADVPTSFVDVMLLNFDKKTSLYQKDASIPEETNINDNTPRMFKRMRKRSQKTIYTDLNTKTALEQINFFGKDFIVFDSIKNIQWKVNASEQKNILGYTCLKASYKDSLKNMVVYFAPQLPFPLGPDRFQGLPGVILEYQSASLHIIATSIKVGVVTVTEPNKGERISSEKFAQIRAEKMQEQKQMWGDRNTPPRNFRP